MADERFETLRKVSLFEGLSDRELEAVAHAAKERRFDTGDTVVVEGEGGVGFFVVADGTARVEAHGKRLGTISSGASFGEVALLDDVGRRSAIGRGGVASARLRADRLAVHAAARAAPVDRGQDRQDARPPAARGGGAGVGGSSGLTGRQLIQSARPC